MFPTLTVVPLFVATLVADASPMQELARPPALTREDIKLARDKFDREMKLDTKRPWDTLQPPVSETTSAKPKPGAGP